jgi:cell wall-associated NlpC family hydrolase
MIKRLEQLAGRLVGVPYEHNGRTIKGLDCLGLVWYVYTQLGISFPAGDGLPVEANWHESDPERYLRGLLAIGKEAIEPLQPLDLVYFRVINDAVTHSGILITGGRFLHVLEGRSVQLTRLQGFWKEKFAGARRLM